MADDMKFSHITVTTDDEDDVVIQAGKKAPASVAPDRAATEGVAAGAAETAEAAPSPSSSTPVSGVSTKVASEASPTSASDASTASAAAAPAQRAAGVSEPSGAPKDTYHATTLEDIESTKMSLTQKVVIALAVLGIAGFAVWYALA
ncbi:MAG: hypothetical protein Q4C41_03850 [Eggerthellaceae bacterium]|nr:hypothetical protein [Eggerthellaceae bacterium]